LDAFASTLSKVDYLVLNQLEFENLLGTSDPELIGSKLGAIRKGIKAIIKRGSEGCTLCGDGVKIIHNRTVPLEKLGLRVVNTVGCGDAFIGAFAAAKVEGAGDRKALRLGCAAGSFKATRKETRGGPTLEQLEELLSRWDKL
jgi:ribokinase